MNYLILGLLFLLSGFFMKFSDDAYDENNDLKLAIIFGILCAIASGVAATIDSGAAYVFIGILIGNLIALKIDGIHHWITLILFIIICLIFGLPELSLAILLVFIFAALADEVGHELIENYTDNNFIILFFEYRFVMKIVIFLLALFGFISFWTFIFFILFEVSYAMAGWLFEK
ncbi:MAG: hypothetical protein IJQ68_05420 [Methanobrevibacter sp.]|nr:hypothetical protein [Methanobrevibacter sp.]